MLKQRRDFLKTASSLALLPSVAAWSGHAQAADSCSGRLIVGTWGGDYQRLLQQNIDPLVASAGSEIVYDVGSALARQTKMRAEKGARRSTLDISLLRDNDLYQMHAEGATARIDAARIANVNHILPAFKRDYAIPHIFSALVLVYNTEKIKAGPNGLAALLDPGLKGKAGVVDDQYDYLTLAGALASGAAATDLARGQNFLRSLKAASPKVYPSVDALAGALKSGEIWVTVTWKARALQWQKAGLPVAYVFPKEGALPATFEAGLAAGSKSQECAYGYLNAMLEPKAQRAFAETMGYAPTVNNADLPPALQQSVGFTASEIERLVQVDFDLLMRNKSALLDFWNKEFRTGL